MDHPVLTVSNFAEYSIGPKRVNLNLEQFEKSVRNTIIDLISVFAPINTHWVIYRFSTMCDPLIPCNIITYTFCTNGMSHKD